MKNFRTILAALLMLCCATLSAHNFEVEGIFYNILSEEDRTVEVTYKGSYGGEYSGEYSGNVVIPANVTYEGTTYSVTTIEDDTFYGCHGLTSIEIPNSVTTIGDNAFSNCNYLTSIEIPNSVTTIGYGAFSGCSGLTSIEIPNSVTTIEDGTFYGCYGLTSIEIPNSVRTIGDEAFNSCNSLTSIEIPNSVTTIGESAFYCCYGLTSIEIPNSVTTIGDNAFRYCDNLTSVTIGNSVTTIGNSAFYACSGLTSITSLIPADKLFIPGADAFYNVPTSCTLYVPAGAKEAYAATEGWNQFTNIVKSAHDFEVDGIFYNILSKENKTVEVTYKGARYNDYSNEYIGEVTIPTNVTYNGTTYSVTTIGDYAFGVCTGLTSIEIPNSVTTIGIEAFSCSSLTSVTIGNSVTTIGEWAFGYCSGLTSIEIPNSVKKIGESAFEYCTSLTSATIGNSVTTIGDRTFHSCTGLTSVTIGNSVTTIGVHAFYRCTGLTSIEIPNSVTTIANSAFSNCNSLTSIEIPNSVTTIGNGAFSGCGLTSVTIGNSVTTIEGYAFYDCNSLTSITSLIPADKLFIPGASAFKYVPTSCTLYVPAGAKETYASTDGWKDFTNIVELTRQCGENAYWTFEEETGTLTISGTGAMYDYSDDDAPWFEYRDRIINVIIDDAITTIGNKTFCGCYNLSNIEIPNAVTSIGDYAFEWCDQLTSVIIPNNVTKIGDFAFQWCNGIRSVTIGNSVTTIGNQAFAYCERITSLDIPDSVTTIGNHAFGACYSLKSINIPNSVTSIGEGAFQYCYDLASISVAAGNTTYDSRDNCNAIIETATNTLISGCQNTVIPNNVTTIGDYAFSNCRSLTSIEIPNSVTTIGNKAFYDCNNLTTITSLIPATELFAVESNVFEGVSNDCTLYVPAGAKETYAATEGWNQFTNIIEIKGYDLTVSAANYATLYLDFNAEIPEGVEAYTASTVDGNRLMMQQVTGILPANTGVIVRAEQGTYTFEQTFEKVDAIESNLLRGSVEDIYITPAKDAKYYVLAMKDGIVGMYEDALTGGTFKNNAHKAYLVLGEKNLGIYDEEVDTENPGMQLSNSYYFDFSGTTAIEPVINEVEDIIYYDLSGRRVENPTRGIYIVNGKKVLVK